ncbi:alpha-amylase [Alkalicoccus chagannorensis]|uniref:alpha-amylase n=1 Tax=Alkalicoccus chagannorensis TaxID=427072 RepID=UPI00047A160C|nr:alpha-amylase [Alkalicoccus chagannorensis]
MPRNHTMMQFFEWHLANDGEHWNRLKEMAPEIRSHGITSLWIPPASKAISQDDNGYGLYDGYDLGEFDQKGTTRTKFGTKKELLDAIDTCRDLGIRVYADVVMNHKAGADDTEQFEVVEVDPDDRTSVISEPFEIEGWTYFDFPGREGKYSDFVWHHHHFNGTDYDHSEGKDGIFRILGEDKDWNEQVDDEFGNYDYLMFANIDYNHPEAREETVKWGTWFAEETRVDGYRLDAIKHINHDFIADFLWKMRETFGDDFYFVGEFWNPDVDAKEAFLEEVHYSIDLFDVGLHYSFHEASQTGEDFDMRTIFDNSLVQRHPVNAVTFVDNHDSQPGESLESWVEDWFKQHAYALILLREDGYPCVFFGDYYGINGNYEMPGKKEQINPLLDARHHAAYGAQQDYFDHPNTIGWVRLGDEDVPGSGCAVVMTNGEEGWKEMYVGELHSGETWIDVTGNCGSSVEIGEDGKASFFAPDGSVSVYIPEPTWQDIQDKDNG